MSTISPDAVGAVDLTIFDRAADDLRQLALDRAVTLAPEWTPAEGNVEVNLIDALTIVVSELIFTINRVPAAVLEDVLGLVGITRDPGAPATTTLTFHLSDTAGHTVPAGTRVRLDAAGQTWVVATDADATALPTFNTVTTSATAAAVGSAPNGVTAGTVLAPIDLLFFADSVTVASTVQDGRDPEDDAAYDARAVERLAELSDVTVLNSQFTARALENPAVGRALTIDTYDGSGGPPYTDAGHVTVVVYGHGGNLASGDKATLLADLQSRVVAGVDVHLLDPTITTVNVTATVAITPGSVGADVTAAVTTALRGYLSPDTWPFAATVRRNELISLIDQVPGVDYVASLTVPAADVALSGDGPLASAGTITIAVGT